ncbi:L,D-transpeptidase [Nocardioides iriomotensis]|nr:L,D-transpeptidase [Nocardioides iriomotensis]
MALPRARHARRPVQRVRYDRVSALVGAAGVTLVSVLGGIGLLPVANAEPARPAAADKPAAASKPDAGKGSATEVPADEPVEVDGAKFGRADDEGRRVARTALAVPADSGDGRRIVFDQTAQRVWLVGDDGKAQRTYLVSGSLEDNLDPGSYEVYSKSKRAWGIDGGTMKFMVRFAHGKNAAIGFHDIPYEDGELLQSRAELGTAKSSGCIRQWRQDAKALWGFAPEGTKVVVVAT